MGVETFLAAMKDLKLPDGSGTVGGAFEVRRCFQCSAKADQKCCRVAFS